VVAPYGGMKALAKRQPKAGVSVGFPTRFPASDSRWERLQLPKLSSHQHSPLSKPSQAQAGDIPPSAWGELGSVPCLGSLSQWLVVPQALAGLLLQSRSFLFPHLCTICYFQCGSPVPPPEPWKGGYRLAPSPPEPLHPAHAQGTDRGTTMLTANAIFSLPGCLLQSREVSCLEVQVNGGRLRKDSMGEPFAD